MTLTVPAQAYPEHTPLRLPEKHPDYPRYQSLLRLERRLFGDWLGWLTTSWCAACTVLGVGCNACIREDSHTASSHARQICNVVVLCAVQSTLVSESVFRLIICTIRKVCAIRRGNDGNRKQFLATMDAVEKALGHFEGPWFMQDYGLVDITFVPFLERVVASIPYYKVPASCPCSG